LSRYVYSLLLSCVYLFLTVPSVLAELIVDPASLPSSSVFTLMDGDPPDDDGTVLINTSGTFQGKFFGTSVGPISVAENGNLNFSANGDFFPTGFTAADTVARIAPLWDDVLLFQPFINRIVSHSVLGSYLAVTWESVLLFNNSLENPLPLLSFQVLWFEFATTLQGFQFQADDIAFGYRSSVAGTNSFGNVFGTVGINSGTGAFTPLPGDPDGDGYIVSSQTDLLAWESDTFLLFRPTSDPTMGYNASKENLDVASVPEPTTSLCLLALLAKWGWRRRNVKTISRG
jgi:hypothetical protein